MMDEIKKIKDNVVEVVNERFFSPMYFYFIVAWLVANWKFVYVLVFSNESLKIGGLEVSKIDFLSTFYPFDTFWNSIFSLLHLALLPLAFSWFAVWVLTGISEKFFRKYETYQQNKRVIQKELEYTEKVRFAHEERKIREAESDKKEISYDENPEFNDYLDDQQGLVDVNGISLKPSEVLYNTDFEAYKDSLKEWQGSVSVEDLTDEQKWEIINEHDEDIKSQSQINEWKDSR